MAMTTLLDCLQEVIGKGPDFFIRSYAIPGSHRTSEWVSTALLTELQRESPGVLEDHAWTEWRWRPDTGMACFIHYGFRGLSMSHQEVPGYGHLRALERSNQKVVDSTWSSPELSVNMRRLVGHTLAS
jgi:hypothetical protein